MTRASDLARLIGAGATINDGTTITTADNTAQLTITSTDADSSSGPRVELIRNSGSPANGDNIGLLVFKAADAAGNTPEEVIQFLGVLEDSADGAEDASLDIRTKIAGNTRSRIDLEASETVFNQEGIDLNFRVESDTNTTAFNVDGANGIIGMGTSFSNVVTVDGRHGIVMNDKTTGFYLGVIQASANGNASGIFNRDADDGSILLFNQDANIEGTISSSGSTISYNAFSGSHWSRLADNSKPTILKGTVIETIDEMMDWYQAQFSIQEEGETRTGKQSIALPSGASVGDKLTVSFEGNDYTATIIKEPDNKHTKCKISDTADSKRVYGVFADWDNDDDTVNDMYVTAIGTHVVRINKDVTVQAGDLLSSNGDGTAKVQDDDIIRSKTIGKVLTNIKQETYSDGSYTVPCALYCG